MKVSLERNSPKSNQWNLSERYTLEAVKLNSVGLNGEIQIGIYWPAGAQTFLSVQPDGSWAEAAELKQKETCNVIPEGFEYNPEWPKLGGLSVVISGRILEP